jgi:putative ABC transport system permease protein
LGIICGVAAVIVMVAIGEGTKGAALEQVQQLGARNILVQSWRPPESSEASARQQRVLEYGVKRADLERLKTIPGIAKFVPLKDTEQRIILGDLRVNANAIATTPDIFDVINLRLEKGRTFGQLEYERGEAVCVLGAGARRQLFPYQDPMGQKIQVGTSGQNVTILTVIGVLEPTGLRAGADSAGIMLRDIDLDIYFPLELARKTFGDAVFRRSAGSMERKQIELSEVWLQAERIEDVERIWKVAENTLSINHKNLQDVNVKAPIQILRNAERTARMFNFVLGGIASVSLIVGGIGIMNIMLASVTERTREIGIRRALGAKQRHITLQFLIETTIISLTGGLIGIALGVVVAIALPPLIAKLGSGESYPTTIATWSVIGSFIVSGSIGIVFGLYPAMTAARMNPIEALRHE